MAWALTKKVPIFVKTDKKKLYLKKLGCYFSTDIYFCNHCSEIYILDTLLRRYLYFTQVVVGYPAVF